MPRSQAFGSCLVNRPGAMATTMMKRISSPEMMNSGLRRRVRHASAHMFEAGADSSIESTAFRGVSSSGAT